MRKTIGWQISLVILFLPLLLVIAVVGVQAAPSPQQATPTVTPPDEATIVNQITALHDTDPLYSDEFRRDDGSWDVAEGETYAISYQQRALHLQVQSDNVYTYSVNHAVTDLALTDYLVEVDAQVVTMPADGQYSLIFRYVDDANFYAFTIRNQEYALLVQRDGEWDALIDFTTTDLIDTTQDVINRLGVLAQGSTITLLVNDTLLTQVEDTTFSGGGVGLVAATYTEGGLEVVFDNLDLWQVSAAPSPTETSAPTAEATLDAAAIAEQLTALHAVDPTFYDEFRRADDQWSAPTNEDVTFSVQQRAFQFQIDAAHTIAWSSNSAITDLALTDALIEVDATRLDGPADGYYGLQFRQVDDENFYRFIVTSSAYQLSKVIDNESIILLDWTDTTALTSDDEWTRLGVLAQGATITLLINDEAVAQVQDDAFTSGTVALVAGAFDEGGLVVAFDNLELWPLTTTPEPADTATPVPTLTPTPAPTLDTAAITDRLNAVRTDEPTYYDEFRRQSDSWAGVSDENVTFAYQNRQLTLNIATANWISWNVNQEILALHPADFLVEVDSERLAGPEDGEYGLVFRYVDNQNLYLYALKADSYGLWRLQNGEWTTVLDWTAASAIDTSEGAVNRLGVLAEGDTITLLVNDTPLTQVTDSSLSAGGIGLAAGALGDGGVEVAFDNLEFWLLAAGPTPTPAPTLDAAAVSVQLDALRNADPTYADSLDEANDEWFVGESGNGVYRYDRAYLIEVTGPATVWSTNSTLSATPVNDYVVEVETEVGDDAETAEYGLLFRYDGNNNFYYFYVAGNQYALLKSVNGEFQSLLPAAESTALKAGANLLSVWVQGSQIILSINDTPVAQLSDTSFVTGTIALAAGTSETETVTVGFENLAFWALDAAVTPTPTTEATGDISTRLEALRNADPLFSDDFSAWDESWTTDVDDTTFLYDEAAANYQMTVNADSQLSFSQNANIDDLALTDYLAEVDGAYVDGPATGDYGLLFRYLDNDNFYFFGLSGNAYLLNKLADGEWTTLIDWTEDSAIKSEQGDVNRLGVLVEGDQITLLINDTVVAQTQDDSLASGGIALAVGTFDDPDYVATFDNVTIWAATPAETTQTTDLVSYESAAFTLQHPADWTVEAQEGGRVVVQHVANEEGIGIWPLYSATEITPDVADLIMQTLAAEAAPNSAEWQEPEEWGEGVRRMVGGDDTHTAVAAITWANSAQGAALYFYFMAAPQADYAALAPVFAQIVESFQITGVPVAATNVADLALVPWEDPDESAYAIDVPEDWTVKGGLTRVSSLDTRPWLLLTSPDEAITLLIGDDRLPSFIVPSAALTAQGYAEGDSFPAGDTELVVQEYTPGEQFAERYGMELLGLDGCEMGEAQPLPELKAAITDYVHTNRLDDAYGTRQDVGAMTYTCGAGDEARSGYLFAFTILVTQPGVEIWQATSLLGYETTPDRVAEAQTILAQVVASWQLSADWLAQQPGLSATDAEARSAASNHFADLIAAVLSSATTSTFDTSVLEVVTTVTDEATDTAYDLLGAADYPWIDEAGNLVGTETPALPADLNVAELVQAE